MCVCVRARARALADEHTILPLSAFEIVHQRTVSKKVLYLEAQLQKEKRVLLILLKLKDCTELRPVFTTLDLMENLFEEVDQVFALHQVAYETIQFALGTLRQFPARISDPASCTFFMHVMFDVNVSEWRRNNHAQGIHGALQGRKK